MTSRIVRQLLALKIDSKKLEILEISRIFVIISSQFRLSSRSCTLYYLF